MEGISSTTAHRGYSRVTFVTEGLGEQSLERERRIQRILQKEKRGLIHSLLCV